MVDEIEPSYGPPAPGGGGTDLKEKLNELFSGLSKILPAIRENIVPIIVLLLLVTIFYVYFFVLPKPGTATITVKELDGAPLEGITVDLVDSSGRSVTSAEITDYSGIAILKNVPSELDLSLQIDAGDKYVIPYQSIRLMSAQDYLLTVSLERRSEVSIKGVYNLPTRVPGGCDDVFKVEVKNDGKEPFEVELVADGDEEFKKMFSFPEKKTVDVASSANFSIGFKVGAVESEEPITKSGSIRVKYTKKEQSVSLTIEKSMEVSFSPTDLTISQSTDTIEYISITNNGKSELAVYSPTVTVEDENTKRACGEDGGNCFTIFDVPPSVKPGKTEKFSIRIIPPSTKGLYSAVILSRVTCASERIRVKLDLRQG